MAILNVYIMSVFAIKKNESTPPPPPYSLVPICVSISLLLLLSFISNTLLNFTAKFEPNGIERRVLLQTIGNPR